MFKYLSLAISRVIILLFYIKNSKKILARKLLTSHRRATRKTFFYKYIKEIVAPLRECVVNFPTYARFIMIPGKTFVSLVFFFFTCSKIFHVQNNFKCARAREEEEEVFLCVVPKVN